MNVDDADRVEELAEIAVAFLSELGGERGLIYHGDEGNATSVTQAFFGLSYDEVEAVQFEFAQVAERNLNVYWEVVRGRQVLVAPLRDPSGDCLGMLYTDTPERFSEEKVESLTLFAANYLRMLLEICIARPTLAPRGLKKGTSG